MWRIKFYNGEKKAHSLVRSLKILCSGLVTRIRADTARGPLGTAASLSLICDEMQEAAETEVQRNQRVSLSDSFVSLRRYRILC